MPVRQVYRALLELHPFEFRLRYAAEMLWIFDQSPAANRMALMLDGAASVFRQWLLRSGLLMFALGLAVNAAIVASCIIAADMSWLGPGR
jgi:hypothetical protein